nr:uncharacterized protein LOC117691423 [Crassostrea gigas]
MDVRNISESVYVGMCLKIGTPQQVASRRDMVDIADMLDNNATLNNQIAWILSGSRKEGFRLSGSDVDRMHWPINHRVIWDFSQVQFYNTQEHALIFCVISESPPGFTLLWLPLERANSTVMSACVRINGKLYISSSKYREVTCSLIRSNSTIHGPCSSGLCGEVEYDYAHCFVSDFWPPPASSWIDRCHSWPPPHVVNDIVRNGCHFVAIGHKLGNHADKEWRISFSRAEYKLVYSMNHTQFLTYGLLKLFLKEIINNGLRDGDKLLCSYHMKTAVFWAIQQHALLQWHPVNLLVGFWVCFKLLLKWVYEGVCPNFFIPENNMFLSNIYGEAQKTLFMQLNRLYEKGITLLLRSPSIRSYIINVLCNPRLTICTDENTLISEVEVDKNIFLEMYANQSPAKQDPRIVKKYLLTVELLIGLPLTQYHIVMLQKHTVSFLQSTALVLHNMHIGTGGSNKQLYIVDKISCYWLRLAATFGFVSDILYIAIYYYQTFRYREALSVIDLTKVKLAQPYLMYEFHVDRERYTEAVGGQSLSTKMRQAIVQAIKLDSEIFFIDKLMPEQQSSKQNNKHVFLIPPLVMLHMLDFLCSRHVDMIRAQRALDDLQVLVHHDQGQLVPVYCRDISWEILGICQQITGNLQAALYSYQQSLRQYQFHKIRTATLQRIQDLHLRTY